MINSIVTKKILNDLNNSLTITQISHKYNVHRNTVRNIKNKYSNNTVFSQFTIGKASKINAAYKNKIKNYCLLHLNCYVYKDNPVKWAHYLCDKLNIEFSELKNYSPEKLETDYSYKCRRTHLATIRRIRNLDYIYKNYGEVYESFKTENFFDEPPISYTSFYNYAKEYWIDIKFQSTLGEIIDNTSSIQKK